MLGALVISRINRVLKHINLHLETCTTDKAEAARLGSLDKSGHFFATGVPGSEAF